MKERDEEVVDPAEWGDAPRRHSATGGRGSGSYVWRCRSVSAGIGACLCPVVVVVSAEGRHDTGLG
jgi:hypothetical protein